MDKSKMAYNVSLYPYDPVVRITDTIDGQSWQASGVLISPDEVLTASHVVYIQGEGTANDIVVTPGFSDGTSPYGSANGTYIHYLLIDDANQTITNQQSQSDYAIIHLSRSFITAGYMSIEANYTGGPVNITGYPTSAGGYQADSAQTVTRDPTYTLLDGTVLGEGSSGGPVWIETSGGPTVVGLVSSASNMNTTGYNTMITTAAFNQIEAWVAQDDAAPIITPAPSPTLSVLDTTIGKPVSATAQNYAGPVSGLEQQYINITADSLNISVTTPSWFLHSGVGTDAIQASSGTNVLDGGTGSSFLTGGTGTDTFFMDDRGSGADIWSTVNGFHPGDSATTWGVTQNVFNLTWMDGQGATGYTGLTLHATAAGAPAASLTLVGFAGADLINGRLTVTYGTTATTGGVTGSAFMYVHAT
jgi:V8-like Glu-specific endopeptidase